MTFLSSFSNSCISLMNQNRPFFSTNTNLYDESFRSSAPATLNGQNVILSQEQQRRIYDTLNTAIVGNNFGLNNGQRNMHVLQAQKQFFPGGVMFTFNQPQHNLPGMCCKCTVPNTVAFDQNNFQFGSNTFFPPTFENQRPFCGVQPLCGLDYPKCQPQASRNPFQLKFHNNHGTSCSDLLSHFTQVPASKGCPDLCNINGLLHQNQVSSDTSQMSNNSSLFFPMPPIEFSSNTKKLILSKNVVPSGHVVDALKENEKNDMDKKKVSFSDDQSESVPKGEKSSQITCDCICDAKKCKPQKTKKQLNKDTCSTGEESSHETPAKKKKEKKRRKKQSKSQTTSSDSTDVSSNSEHMSDSEKPKKFRFWNKPRQTKKTVPSDTSDTESENSESNGKERKISKKRKKTNPSKNLSADTDDEQNISDSSNQQSSTSDHSHSDENKTRFVLCDKCLTEISNME